MEYGAPVLQVNSIDDVQLNHVSSSAVNTYIKWSSQGF